MIPSDIRRIVPAAMIAISASMLCGCAQQQAAPSASGERIEQLQRENESLRQQVEALREQNRARAQLLQHSGEDAAQLQRTRQTNKTLREECAGITADLQQQVHDLQVANDRLGKQLRETVGQLADEQNRRARDLQNCERRIHEARAEADRLKR